MKIKRKAVCITGTVQGVWYRKSTKTLADQLGLAGFVRNEPDGSVYAEIEGEGPVLEKMIEWCEMGPEQSKVISVKSEDIPVLGEGSFEIRRD